MFMSIILVTNNSGYLNVGNLFTINLASLSLEKTSTNN